MKINNPTNIPQNSDDEKSVTSTPKTDQLNTPILHPPSPEDSPGINRLNPSQNADLQDQEINTHLPPPIDFAHYAATGSLNAIQDKLLAAAEKILLSQSNEPAVVARHQVIELVLRENFRTLLTNKEQHDLTDTLKKALSNDPIFCSEVDNMLQIAARKLEIDSQS